jgi:uncharacterized membrane protein
MRLSLKLAFLSMIASVCYASAFANAQSAKYQDRWTLRPHYVITDLGTLGGPFSNSFGINERNHVGGSSLTPDGRLLAYLWTEEQGMQPLGTLLGGLNSAASGPNNHDLVPIISDTDIKDPFNENFCGFGTPFLCEAGVWRRGSLSFLEPLVPLSNHGGNNTQNSDSNNRGEIVGFAEDGVPDPTCIQATPGLRFDFQAVLWNVRGQIHKLATLSGDTVGFAISVNDLGQAVGASGLCSNTPLFPLASGPHAVLWDDAGNPTSVPGLGGTKNNTGTSINNLGVVLGASDLPGDKTSHAYLWAKLLPHSIDLGTLPGDHSSMPGGLGALNDLVEAVGASCASTDPLSDLMSGNCRAFLWQFGQMLDLNSLTSPKENPSHLRLLFAFGINNRGEVTGWALTPSGELHAFVAEVRHSF